MSLTESQQAALGRDHLRRAAARGVDSCAALERYIAALEARIGQLEAQLVARGAPWDRPESPHTTRTSDDVLFLDGQPVEYHYTTPKTPADVRKPILVRVGSDWRKPDSTLGG